MKKIIFLSLLVSSFSFAQPIKRDLVVDLLPQSLTVQLSCSVIPDDAFGDDIKINLKGQGSKTDVFHSLMISNAEDILALKTCDDFIQLTSIPSSKWIQHKTPNFPLTTPSRPIYNFKLDGKHWLLLKDLTASSETQPIYQAFVWSKKGQWQLLPGFFNDLSFYGFDDKNIITGFYESGFFIKHTNQLKNLKLQSNKKEIWMGDRMVKAYSPDDAIVFEK